MSFVISKGPISSHGPDGLQLLHDSDHCRRQLFGATGHGRPETDQGNRNLEIDVHTFDVYINHKAHMFIHFLKFVSKNDPVLFFIMAKYVRNLGFLIVVACLRPPFYSIVTAKRNLAKFELLSQIPSGKLT